MLPSGRLSPSALPPDTAQISWGKPSFPAHPPDLQSRPLMDMDFATSCPLVRPLLPHIRLLFVGSRVRSTLPSDGSSRFRPCASLVLHLHQVAQGTFTPRTLGMPSTQAAARRLRRESPVSLDRRSAPRTLMCRPGWRNGPFSRKEYLSRLGRDRACDAREEVVACTAAQASGAVETMFAQSGVRNESIGEDTMTRASRWARRRPRTTFPEHPSTMFMIPPRLPKHAHARSLHS
jgi:hypothetical protein